MGKFSGPQPSTGLSIKADVAAPHTQIRSVRPVIRLAFAKRRRPGICCQNGLVLVPTNVLAEIITRAMMAIEICLMLNLYTFALPPLTPQYMNKARMPTVTPAMPFLDCDK